MVSGAGGVAGVPGGEQDVVVAGGGGEWCVKSHNTALSYSHIGEAFDILKLPASPLFH